MEDGDRYNLQYRTAGDDRVRPEHAALNGVTLPPSDDFWELYYSPNGWRCRCTVVQVRKKKHPATPHDEAMALGEAALERDTKGMFRFNPGKQERVFPAYNAYTQERCRNCQLGGKETLGKMELVRRDQLPNSQLCDTCRFMNHCAMYDDAEYGRRLRISQGADLSELAHNRRAAAAILDNFDDVEIKINPHFILPNLKNPEYTIKGILADRKGIESEKGVSSAFSKAIKQGCGIVVIDLDMHMSERPLNAYLLARGIYNRYRDFNDGIIKECYVIYRNKAVRIDASSFISGDKLTSTNVIRSIIENAAI